MAKRGPQLPGQLLEELGLGSGVSSNLIFDPANTVKLRSRPETAVASSREKMSGGRIVRIAKRVKPSITPALRLPQRLNQLM
jgi:hypothetical protein